MTGRRPGLRVWADGAGVEGGTGQVGFGSVVGSAWENPCGSGYWAAVR